MLSILIIIKYKYKFTFLFLFVTRITLESAIKNKIF